MSGSQLSVTVRNARLDAIELLSVSITATQSVTITAFTITDTNA